MGGARGQGVVGGAGVMSVKGGREEWNVKKEICRTGSDSEGQGLIGKGTKAWRN